MKTTKETLSWLRGNLPKHALGALTSTDTAALLASVAIIELMAHAGKSADLLSAYVLVVSKMQAHTRYFAFHSIAMVLDWSDRGRIWIEAGLSTDDIAGKPKCKFES